MNGNDRMNTNTQIIPRGSALTHRTMPFFTKIRTQNGRVRATDRASAFTVLMVLGGVMFLSVAIFTYRIRNMDLYGFMLTGTLTIVPFILALWSTRVKREMTWCEKTGRGTFLDRSWFGPSRSADCSSEDIVIRLQEIEPQGSSGPRFHAAILFCGDFVFLLCASKNEQKVAQYVDRLPPILANATRLTETCPDEL